MILESKYAMGQTVCQIANVQKEVHNDCITCHGTGKVVINETPERSCPDCWGRCYFVKWLPTEWRILGNLRIGHIRAEITHDEDPKVAYMCYETGIGSGTVHSESTLFPTRSLAQKECDKRNKE